MAGRAGWEVRGGEASDDSRNAARKILRGGRGKAGKKGESCRQSRHQRTPKVRLFRPVCSTETFAISANLEHKATLHSKGQGGRHGSRAVISSRVHGSGLKTLWHGAHGLLPCLQKLSACPPALAAGRRPPASRTVTVAHPIPPPCAGEEHSKSWLRRGWTISGSNLGRYLPAAARPGLLRTLGVCRFREPNHITRTARGIKKHGGHNTTQY